MKAVARRMDPPISKRTAEAHVASIAEKIPADFEPLCPGFWRVVLWAVYPESGPSDTSSASLRRAGAPNGAGGSPRAGVKRPRSSESP